MTYEPSTSEILYSIEHVAGGHALEGWDKELLSEFLHSYSTLCEEHVRPLNSIGDAQGAALMDGRVVLPAGFKEAFEIYADNGWMGLTIPEQYGGHGLTEIGMDGLALAGTSELLSGTNHAFQMLVGLAPGLVRVLLRFGTTDQQAFYLPKLASGHCLATMVLTEPQAGSDLRQIRCKASQNSGQNWRLSGEKIFISNGDQNASAQIAHLVLARTSDDGLKGLSMFISPSVLPNGERNSISVDRVEHKMGIKASPTCHLLFEDAEAEIIGKPGEGLRLMFEMMNHARLDVALQGVAHASKVRSITQTYAADRVQGGTAIQNHPGITKKLERIEMMEIAARSIAHFALVKLEQGEHDDLVSFLTPLAKVYCSEVGFEAAQLGMNILGGYGYLEDHEISQSLRDSKITQIYEGTNDIHQAAMVTRLNAKPHEAFSAVLSSISPLAAKTWVEARNLLLASQEPRFLGSEFAELTALCLSQALLANPDLPQDEWPHSISLERLRALLALEMEIAALRFGLTAKTPSAA